MIEAGALGKKVFFLNPPPVLGEVVEELGRQEFEVYLVYDEVKLQRVLAQDSDSIVFANIDNGAKEKDWTQYIMSIRNDPKTAAVGLGVVSMNEDRELMQLYLMELQLPCGYIVVKLGASKTAEILSKTLEANEARGRRKFVRATCPTGVALAYVDIDGKTFRAEVSDLSSAGCALRFDDALVCKPGTVLRGLQLNIKGVRVLADGFVAAKRDDGDRPTHIVMFAPASLDDERRDKIRNLVFKLNQANMDRLLASI